MLLPDALRYAAYRSRHRGPFDPTASPLILAENCRKGAENRGFIERMRVSRIFGIGWWARWRQAGRAARRRRCLGQVIQPKDAGIMVEIVNAVSAGVRRPIQFFEKVAFENVVYTCANPSSSASAAPPTPCRRDRLGRERAWRFQSFASTLEPGLIDADASAWQERKVRLGP